MGFSHVVTVILAMIVTGVGVLTAAATGCADRCCWPFVGSLLPSVLIAYKTSRVDLLPSTTTIICLSS